MADIGKVLYDIWVAKMLKNAVIIEEKWEDLDRLEQQAWSETADAFKEY
jgi:hypothetical protein